MAWFKFNDFDSSSYFKIQDIRRPVLPARRYSSFYVSNGIATSKLKWDSYPIEVDVVLISKSEQIHRNTIRQIAENLSDESAELIFYDEPDISYTDVFVDNFDALSEILLVGKGTIVFKPRNTFAEGLQKTYDIQNNATINYQSTTISKPVFNIVFTKNVSNFEIKKGQKSFKLIREFTVGDRVTIDCKKNSIIRNNANVMVIMDLRSRWKDLYLNKGNNMYSVTPDVANVEISFTENWI